MVELKLPKGEIVRGYKDMNGNVATVDGFVYSRDGSVLCKPGLAPGAQNPRTHQTAGCDGTNFTPGVTLIGADKVRPESISWLWRGWLARGKVHILAGAPSAGKTSAALALAAIITRAGRWPDGSASEIGTVAVWSGEDGIRDVLVPRLLAADADTARVKLVSSFSDYSGSRAETVTDPEERSAKEDAKDFLRKILAAGPVPSKEVFKEAEEAGHSKRTVQRAQRELGIKPEKNGSGPWLWALPTKDRQHLGKPGNTADFEGDG